jgi:AraC-like DNA-binding protein
MTDVSSQLFESRRIVDQDGRCLSAEFSGRERWLSSVGCFVQANNRRFSASLNSETVVKPGVLIGLVLKGLGKGGPWGEAARLHFGDNTLVALALRAPTRWWGQVPRGTHVQSIGLAFPATSLDDLNLRDDFAKLFEATDENVVTVSVKAGPRLQAIAAEMLSPPLNGNPGRLLLEAHAVEVLAHTMAAFEGCEGIAAVNVGDRMRLRSLCDSIDANLRRSWSLAELAKEAGLSKRALNAKFRETFGLTVFDYLKQRRLEFARAALVHQQLTVAEAAYRVGYENPANFATAFRRHFGLSPSACRKQSGTL